MIYINDSDVSNDLAHKLKTIYMKWRNVIKTVFYHDKLIYKFKNLDWFEAFSQDPLWWLFEKRWESNQDYKL